MNYHTHSGPGCWYEINTVMEDASYVIIGICKTGEQRRYDIDWTMDSYSVAKLIHFNVGFFYTYSCPRKHLDTCWVGKLNKTRDKIRARMLLLGSRHDGRNLVKSHADASTHVVHKDNKDEASP